MLLSLLSGANIFAVRKSAGQDDQNERERGIHLRSMRKELLSAIKLACHEFGVTNKSFSVLKGFFARSGAPGKNLPKSHQTLFFTFTFER
ncbi:hypothetical protein [Pseudomonas syringae]|uniref:hypothetical protein n=1 Tax=Pseudomonas syringae TaxID=317 RepID=UPI0015C49428|nr:hypothetical protein [Pseudomonas syringae]